MMRLRRLHVRYTRSGELAADELGDPWQRLPSVARPEWRPPCDVYETPDAWLVKVEIAGVDDEQDVDVQVYEDVVVVEGRRPWRVPAESPGLHVHAAEIRHGPFRVAVRLPDAVDAEAATRSYDRGLLAIRLPKARPS